MSTGSQSIIREIEESLARWKTDNNKQLSWRLSYIQSCRDMKYARLLFKDICRIERLKWRAIDSLTGTFSKEEWEVVFNGCDAMYYYIGYKEFRNKIQENIEYYYLNRLRKYKIQKAGFYRKITHLSKRKSEMIYWLYRYSRDNQSGSHYEIIGYMTDTAKVRKQKIKKLNRKSH